MELERGAGSSGAGGRGRSASDLSQEKAYVRKIERRFLALRGSGLFLSPRDFALLLDWNQRGIPAALVISSLEEMFAKSAERSEARAIQSIAYCRKAVERAWEERRAALLGPPAPVERDTRGAFTMQEVADHLERTAARTMAAAEALGKAATGDVPDSRGDLCDALRGIAARLDLLRERVVQDHPADLRALEAELVALEARALEIAQPALSEPVLEELARSAEASLAAFAGRMSARARAATLKRAVESSVRRRLDLPRYSLFTLSH